MSAVMMFGGQMSIVKIFRLEEWQAATRRVTQWSLDFTEHSEQGDRKIKCSKEDVSLKGWQQAAVNVGSAFDSSFRGDNWKLAVERVLERMKDNPEGRVSDKMDPNDLVKLIEILNPQNKA
ncbi:hypothetical protein MKW98_030671 [Papaver atlanticum]|uniref:3-deoxy-7-phosphoheptulonate synthase n=1 Tax=Papaver atlanticum TaxID=357466 RepID=A0AAD4X2N2_9MAGN|nr:hypothetical protein MKW98_030671 [Papaver atlanticum]